MEQKCTKPQLEYDRIIGRKVKTGKKPKVFIYDFKRPDKFSFDQIRTVSIMHEIFARLLTTSLSARLRSHAHMHVASVDQLTYEEFMRSIPNPATLAVINMDPLKGSVIMEIDPAITFSMIDRLFGGTGEHIKFSRDLTDIEQSVMEVIIVEMLGGLREAWCTVIDLRPRLGQIETNPTYAQIVPPTEMVILVTLEAKIQESEGMVNLCVPYLTIEPIIHKLSAQYWYSSVRKEPQKTKPDVSSFALDSEVFFEGEDILLSDVPDMKKNSLIRLPGYTGGVGFLRSGGREVVKLTHEPGNRKKQRVFHVIKEDGEDEEIDELLSTDLYQKKNNEIKQLEEIIKAPVNELTKEFRQNMEELNKKIRKVNNRQDELIDQLYFSMPDKEIPADNKEPRFKKRPFSFINSSDTELLYMLICQEHPQTIALVLSYLDANVSAYILSRLFQELQVDVLKRIARLNRTAPDILTEIERVLEIKLKAASIEKHVSAGGIGTVCEILNTTSRAVEDTIIETLEQLDPELAEDIKAHIFVFEDIPHIDDQYIKVILKNIDKQDLLMALKTVDDQLKDVFYRNMSPTETKEFKEEFTALGSMRLKDVEAAQKRIVQVIKELDEAGAIIVGRKDELV